VTTYYVPNAKLARLLDDLPGAVLLAPQPTDKLAWLDQFEGESSLQALRSARPAQSPKGLFLPARESLGRYGKETPAATTAIQTQKVVILGVRACELRARNYLHKVLAEGEFDDQAFRQRSDDTTIISCDCVDCAESCFCTLVGGRPYCTEGFDVNLSPVAGGFVLQIGSDKGEQLLKGANLDGASPAQLAERDENRKKMTERLERQNQQFTFRSDDKTQPELPEGDDEAWQRFAADCVECAACTNICPTCYCFYLYDQLLGVELFERVRTWDSCLLSSYHRMAGGVHMKLSPRPRLSARLANRVLHKFTYSPQQLELLGCVGCGRCVEACLGAIDIRQVVEDLGK